MQLKQIKNFMGWEVFLFVLVHFAILLNIFALFAIFIIVYMTFSDITIGNINLFIFFAMLFFPFVIIKYLSLPITLCIIKKWSKNEEIKNWITTIAESYKFQAMILFAAIIVDSVVIFINYKYPELYFNTYNFWYLIFGGLTGSYLAIFLFEFIRKKAIRFKKWTTKEFSKNTENEA